MAAAYAGSRVNCGIGPLGGYVRASAFGRLLVDPHCIEAGGPFSPVGGHLPDAARAHLPPAAALDTTPWLGKRALHTEVQAETRGDGQGLPSAQS